MFRKITDVWPQLLGESQNREEEKLEVDLQEQADGPDIGDAPQNDNLQEVKLAEEKDIRAAFKNQNWT